VQEYFFTGIRLNFDPFGGLFLVFSKSNRAIVFKFYTIKLRYYMQVLIDFCVILII